MRSRSKIDSDLSGRDPGTLSAQNAQWHAFQRAVLRSERLRALGLLVALAVGLLIGVVRLLVAGAEGQHELFVRVLVLIGGLAAYELAMLAVVDRAIRCGRLLPAWVWALSLLIEALFPTLAIWLLTESAFMGPFKALVAPVSLVYLLFIIASTLRLSLVLSLLTGLFAALGYSAVTAYTYARYRDVGSAGDLFPLQIYATQAALLLLAGAIAAWVARQVREHVFAALREAETRRRAERMEHDLEIARSIQRGLLPAGSPRVAGFDVAGWNQPADATGGDYYDWQELPGGRTVISLADVTGHGIGPALVTAACRAYGRASMSLLPDLGTVLARLNDLLGEDLQPGKLVTFVVALLDEATAKAQILSAGHGPLFFYRAAEDRVERFGAHGIPFGVARGIPFGPAQELSMEPGDVLLLITDGFFEWSNRADEEFGVERIGETIRGASQLPAEEIIARLYEEVLEFADGATQEDDLTAVVVKARTL